MDTQRSEDFRAARLDWAAGYSIRRRRSAAGIDEFDLLDPELEHTETYPTRAEAQTALDRIRASYESNYDDS